MRFRVGINREFRLYGLPAVATLITLVAIVWFTPLLAPREIVIEGAVAVREDQIRQVLDIPEGLSILRINTAELAARVATLPKIRSVRVRRSLPTTVRISVGERKPVLYYLTPEGAHLLDSDSVEFAIEAAPIGVPQLNTPHPSPSDRLTRAAAAVAAAVPRELAVQISEVNALSRSEISLALRDGRTVLWGSDADTERKSAVVLPLLTRPGTIFDISSPSLVTVR